MRALIVGAGTMGRWFAELTRGWWSIAVTDVDEDTARNAAQTLDVSVAGPDEDRFDVVCIAVPLTATPEVIGQYAGRADRAVVDLSGSMRDPLAAMRTHATDRERISLHPLFAPENAPGTIAVVVENGGDVAETLRARLRERGYELFATTATEHDRAMENVQAKVHAAVLAYALAAEPVDERFHTPVSSEVSRLLELVLDGNPRVYADIQRQYDGAEQLADAAAQLAESDPETFSELFRTARERHVGTDDGG